MAVDSTGNVFIADTYNSVIRKVTTAGTISTFATDPNFCDLLQMAIDSANNLYVADDCAGVIFKITPAAVVSVFAGVLNQFGYNGDNIPATNAWLNGAVGVGVDTHGNVLIPDTYNSRVREVNPSGIIGTIAGDGICNYSGDGDPPPPPNCAHGDRPRIAHPQNRRWHRHRLCQLRFRGFQWRWIMAALHCLR